MQPKMEGECYVVGKIWSYRSEASDDLDIVYNMLSDIPRCDTKAEMLHLIRCVTSKLDMMKARIKTAGTDYLLKDAVE